MKEIVLYGAGGAGRELAFGLSIGNEWQVIGFVDDTMQAGEWVDGIRTLGGEEWLRWYAGPVALCIVGKPKVKQGIIEALQALTGDIYFPVLIDSHSIVHPSVQFGEGCIVAQPYNHITVGVKLGCHVWVNSYTGIGHDVTIGDYTTIYTAAQIGGGCRIGSFCVIGTGAILRPGVKIGAGVTVGGGAVVVKDVRDGVTVAGVPAREIGGKA